jgi:hypothetical protein
MPPDDHDWSQYLKKPDQPSSGGDDWSQFTKKPGQAADPSDPVAKAREEVGAGEGFKGLTTGFGKGLIGDIVGLGQVAERGVDYFRPGTSAAVKSGLDAVVPGTSSALHSTKEWTTSPSKSWSETAGNVIGGALPFAFAGPAGLAGRVGLGALAGAAQPTQSGSMGSHLENMIAGGVTAGVLSPAIAERAVRLAQAGGEMAAVEFIARHIGVPPWLAAGMLGMGEMYRMGRGPTGLSRLAGQGMAKVPPQAAGVEGAAGGQAATAAEQNLGQ